jgi:hypothetical protein
MKFGILQKNVNCSRISYFSNISLSDLIFIRNSLFLTLDHVFSVIRYSIFYFIKGAPSGLGCGAK